MPLTTFEITDKIVTQHKVKLASASVCCIDSVRQLYIEEIQQMKHCHHKFNSFDIIV